MYHPPPIAQASEATGSDEKTKRSVDLGLFGCLLFVPLMLIAGVLSIPYGLAWNVVENRKRRRLQKDLSKAGRGIEWAEFVQVMAAGRGTVIIEKYFPKGPWRWWWTEDDVRARCPYPMTDAREIEIGAEFDSDPAGDWFVEQYTNTVTGKGRLVIHTREERESSSEILKSVRVITLHRDNLRKPKNLSIKT
jgi:hypothetical protein